MTDSEFWLFSFRFFSQNFSEFFDFFSRNGIGKFDLAEKKTKHLSRAVVHLVPPKQLKQTNQNFGFHLFSPQSRHSPSPGNSMGRFESWLVLSWAFSFSVLFWPTSAHYDFDWPPWNVTFPGWHRYKYFQVPNETSIVRQHVLQEQSPR